MGNFSFLRFVIANTPIHWTRVPEGLKKSLGHWKYHSDPLPTAVADLAKMFDESKFFGYFETNLRTLLMDISEFGLQARISKCFLNPSLLV